MQKQLARHRLPGHRSTASVPHSRHPGAATLSAPSSRQNQSSNRWRQQLAQPAAALRIDRAAHLEAAWQRQAAAEAASKDSQGNIGGVVEVRDLQHLDAVVDGACEKVVAIAFYSRSCGACRRMMGRFEAMSREAVAQRAGVTFLKHDIRTEHDDLSDLARLYKLRATPTFAFLVGGAKVLEVRMRDTRSMSGSSAAIQSHLAAAEGRLAAALRAVLFRSAPSARR